MSSTKRVHKEMDKEHQVAEILLEEGVVAVNPGQPFVYASGIVSPIYCDLRLLMGSPKQRSRVVELLEVVISDRCDLKSVDIVAGVATAGIPWAAWVADRLGKPMAYVRDAPKEHGKGQQVEGGVAAGQRAIVVEDLTSTGASAINAAEALRSVGALVDQCFSIFTYEFKESREGFLHAGVDLESLCGVSTLLKVATSSGRISKDEEQAVREWLAARRPAGASRAGAVQP